MQPWDGQDFPWASRALRPCFLSSHTLVGRREVLSKGFLPSALNTGVSLLPTQKEQKHGSMTMVTMATVMMKRVIIMMTILIFFGQLRCGRPMLSALHLLF